MTFEQLTYLVAIAKEGTISSVAERYHISHSAISRAISNLETELGVRLFSRNRMGSFITEEGKQAVAVAEKILEQAEQLKSLHSSGNMVGTLHIGTSFFLSSLVADITTEFSRRFPGITPHLASVEPEKLLNMLSSNELDFGFSFYPEAAIPSIRDRFKVKRLLDSELVVFFTAESPLANLSAIEAKHICGQHFVLWSDRYVNDELNGLIDLNQSGNTVTYINHSEAMFRFILQNNCVGTSSLAFIRNLPLVTEGKLRYAPILRNGKPVYMCYCYVAQRGKHASSAESAFVDLCSQALDKWAL